jgi:pyridoxamine 5'-phosphate oxidase
MTAMDFENPPADPVAQVAAWLDEAARTPVINPHAMTLATVDPDGNPSARTVLLKGFDQRGAVFYTNRNSRKGRALAAHPRAALLLHWDSLLRQVGIEGGVTQVDEAESDVYFATRPRGAQLGAWVSQQSEPVESRAVIEAQIDAMTRRFEGGPVPRPPHWSGYRVALESIELWQGRIDRLHDRIVYTRDANGVWTTQRLSP